MKKDTFKNVLILVLIALSAYLFFNKPVIEKEEPIELDDLSGIISRKEALKLQDAYIKSRAVILKDTFGYQDARSFTISLDRAENYLKYIRTAYGTNKDSILKYPNLGVRYYLGSKPEGTLKDGIATMFVVPTTTPNNTQEGGFLNTMPPSSPSNIPGGGVQDDYGNDHPPLDY